MISRQEKIEWVAWEIIMNGEVNLLSPPDFIADVQKRVTEILNHPLYRKYLAGAPK